MKEYQSFTLIMISRRSRRQNKIKRSILFNAIKTLRIPNGLPKTLPVFDMAGVVADSRVEDIV